MIKQEVSVKNRIKIRACVLIENSKHLLGNHLKSRALVIRKAVKNYEYFRIILLISSITIIVII